MGACNTAVSQAQGNLATCTTSLGQAQAGLNTCTTSLGTCTTQLTTCTSDLAASQAATCGNGTVEGAEDCDVGTLNGATCETERFAGGPLACGPGCMFDTSGCYANRFEDNGDGTITDNQTRLMWEKKSDDGSVHHKANTYRWSIVVGGSTPNGTVFTDFLGTLNNCVGSEHPTAVAGGFAGHCDWRLPTVTELQTILLAPCPVSPLFDQPCVDSVFNNGTDSFTFVSDYWSSITPPGSPFQVWTLNFNNGLLDDTSSKGNPLVVRAVRGGQ